MKNGGNAEMLDRVRVRTLDGWLWMAHGMRAAGGGCVRAVFWQAALTEPGYAFAIAYRRCLMPSPGPEGCLAAGLYDGKFGCAVLTCADGLPLYIALPETQALWLTQEEFSPILLAWAAEKNASPRTP